jgi:flagellar capping protein FliD
MTETEQSLKPETERKAGIRPLDLQVVAEPSDRRVYQLGELLSYHDRAFVINAYRAIAKRQPSQAELTQTQEQLRSGRLSKTEILESLLASQSSVRVEGLPSSRLSRFTHWPVIGYMLRVLKAFARLPLLIRHQQEFETFALAQQQRITDYINDVLAPAFMSDDDAAGGQLAATVSDAVDTVSMLADSLVDLSAQQADIQTRIQKLQEQREQSEAQLHADLVALTGALASLQQKLTQAEIKLHSELVATAASQREFLVEEQRLIVEAQHLALNDLQDQLTAITHEQEVKHLELAAEIKRMRALIEPLPARSRKHEVSSELDQP